MGRMKRVIGIVLVILGISFIGITFFYQYKKSIKYDYNSLIKYKGFDIVYSLSNENIKKNDRIPVINIDSDKIEAINSSIIELYNFNALEKDYSFDYKYNVSKDTLSILITMNNVVDGKDYYSFASYNINLSNYNVLTNEEILNYFDLDGDDIDFYLNNKFFNYYDKLTYKNVINQNDCDFECFIVNCNFQDYSEDNTYYINKNGLEIYKFFNIYNDYNYDKYFTLDSFKFVVR